MTDLAGAVWRKSTRSGGNGGNCVEVATNLPGIVAVRDSKDTTGPMLAFTLQAWAGFITATKSDGCVGRSSAASRRTMNGIR